MGVFELHNARKYCVGSGLAPQPPTPLHSTGQAGFFWMPGVGVFEMHDGKKCCWGSVVAHQPPMALQAMGQKKCLWIPRMGAFEIHHAKKMLLGFWGSTPTIETTAHHGPEKVLLDGVPRMGVFEMHDGIIVGVLG